MNKLKVKIIFGLIFSILALLLIILIVDLHEVWENLQKLSWFIIITVSSLYLVNMILRSVRWQIIIAEKSNCPLHLVFKAMIYGYMLNQLLPAKMGEIGRAEYLTRKIKESRSFLLATVGVERIFDMLIISMFFGFSILFSETIMNNLKSNLIPVMILLTGFFGAIIMLFNLNLLKKITRYLPSKAEQFTNHIVDNMLLAFGMFKSYRKVLIISLASFIIWGLTCFTFYLILRDLDLSIPFYAYFFIVSVGTFGMIIPSTSANVGVYHALVMSALIIFMVPSSQALSFAILAHAFDFFPSVILGGIFFGYGRLNGLKNKQKIEMDAAKN